MAEIQPTAHQNTPRGLPSCYHRVHLNDDEKLSSPEGLHHTYVNFLAQKSCVYFDLDQNEAGPRMIRGNEVGQRAEEGGK